MPLNTARPYQTIQSNDGRSYYQQDGYFYDGNGNQCLSIPPSQPSNPISIPPPTLTSFPQSVFAQAGNLSATVQWTPVPGVSGYLVTSNPSGIQVQTSGVSATVTGLQNGISYTFTVLCLLGSVQSTSSTTSNAVTPSALATNVFSAYAPSLASGLVFWLSATQFAATGSAPNNGANVTNWPDMSGNGFNFGLNIAGTNPTWVSSWSNGKPAVNGNGINNQLDSKGSNPLNVGRFGPINTLAVLYDVTASPNSNGSVYGGHVFGAEGNNTTASTLMSQVTGFAISTLPQTTSANRSGICILSGGSAAPNAGQLTRTPTDLTTVTTAAQIAIVTSPGQAVVSQDGGSTWQTLSAVNVEQIPYSADAYYTLFGPQNNAFNLTHQGRIAEVILWNRLLSAVEITALQSYLNSIH